MLEEFKNRKKHEAEEKARLKHERDIEMALVNKTPQQERDEQTKTPESDTSERRMIEKWRTILTQQKVTRGSDAKNFTPKYKNRTPVRQRRE